MIAAVGPGEVLLGALLLVILYGAFSHGASSEPAEPRLQVVVAAVAALAGGVWIWGASLHARAPRSAWVGVGLLAGFTVWSAVTLAWSVSAQGTWTELNRYITYTLFLLLAILAGSSVPRAREFLRAGFLGIAVIVALYGLGQKLVPGLHVSGVFDFNQTGQVPRLQMPFGYWNALALFIAMAVPMALSVAIDVSQSRRARLSAIVALELFFLVIGDTYSRGGLVALAVAIIVLLRLGRCGLKGLLWLATAAVTTVVPLVFELHSHALTTPKASLSDRQSTGAELAAVLIVSLVVLVLAGRRLLDLERTVRITPVRSRAITRLLLALVGVAVLIGLVAITVSHRGLTGTISHTYHDLTNTSTLTDTNPDRLLSDKFGFRLLWWKEALRAFGARPLGGWGAGSFPVVHLFFRRNGLSVRQAHSVPLQDLAETGLIGALLAIGAFVALLRAGVRAVREQTTPAERLRAAALLAAVLAYGLHAWYDWDSDIPGITLPMLAFIGVLVGSLRDRQDRAGRSEYAHLPTGGVGPRRVGPGPGLRTCAIVLSTLTMCAFAASAALPSIAGQKASDAVLAAARGALSLADQQASTVTRLDPLNDAGLYLQATIALRLAQQPGKRELAAPELQRARRLIGEAIARDPSDVAAWSTLVQIELLAHQYQAGIAAAQRVLDLDPAGEDSIPFYVAGLAQGASLLIAPPQDSATAIATP